MKVNLLIPFAGADTRFRKAGYVLPKPLIDIAGKPIINWLTQNYMCPSIEFNVIAIVQEAHDTDNKLSEGLRRAVPNLQVVYARSLTDGVLSSVLLAKDLICSDTPLLVVGSNHYLDWDNSKFWDQAQHLGSDLDGLVLSFRAAPDSRQTESQDEIPAIQFWKKGSSFVEHGTKAISNRPADRTDEGLRKSNSMNNLCEAAIAQDCALKQFEIAGHGWPLSQPEDLAIFLQHFIRPRSEARKYKQDLPPSFKFISRRGNLAGAHPELENTPTYIMAALKQGFHCQIDVWWKEDEQKWYLGSETPANEISFNFLLQPMLWLRARDQTALAKLLQDGRVNCFYHERDACTITSKGFLWAMPGAVVTNKGNAHGNNNSSVIAAGFPNPRELDFSTLGGCCTDEIQVVQELTSCVWEGKQQRASPNPIKLVVFDLDGVLVESKELHYEALNKALEVVAGQDFVIDRREHESVYDGLSTNQKLHILTKQKNLPTSLHKAVWTKKQELTEQMFTTWLKPDHDVQATLATIKSLGFPVAVASNCIKQSVYGILKSIDVLQYIDAYLSNEDVTHAKPFPDIYEKAASIFGVATHEVLVVEDSVKGFEAATRAGCHLCKVDSPADVRIPYIMDSIKNIEQISWPEVNIVIPLAGSGEVFWLDGPEAPPTEVPIHLMDVRGKCMLQHVIESFKPKCTHRFVFVAREEHVLKFNLHSMLARITDFSPMKVVTAKSFTKGALVSALLCERYINNDTKLLICDGRHVVRWNTSADDFLNQPAQGALTSHVTNNPSNSYLKIQPGTNTVVAVKEKDPISNLACTGMYMWKKGSDFVTCARRTIAKGCTAQGIFFIAPSYSEALDQGMKIVSVPVAGCWHLRNQKEIQVYDRQFYPYVAESNMEGIYSTLVSSFSKAIESQGFTCDTQLLAECDKKQEDCRRFLSVHAPCTPDTFSTTPAFDQLLQEVERVMGEQHAYYRVSPQARLHGHAHLALMTLVKEDLFADVALPSDYFDVMEAMFIALQPSFQVEFTHLIVAPEGIALTGCPTTDINFVRNRVRQELTRIGYPLFEASRTDAVTLPLCRFASPVTQVQSFSLKELAKQYTSSTLATLKVSTLTMRPVTWLYEVNGEGGNGRDIHLVD